MLGFYLPVKRKDGARELQDALRELGDSLAELRRETGLSEDELVEELVPGEHKDQARGRTGG